jgi:MFS family permease
LVRLCAAGFVAYCSYSICRAPLLPLFARELGAGPSLIGFVMGASTLTGVFLKLPAGALSDLFGRRRLLVAGALVFATLPFSYLAVSTLAWLVVLRFLHGSATAIYDIGDALGPIVAGALVAWLGYAQMFQVMAVVALMMAVVFAIGTARQPSRA